MFFDKRYSFTELDNPDFIKLAEAYGIKAQKVSERGDLQEAIDKHSKLEAKQKSKTDTADAEA